MLRSSFTVFGVALGLTASALTVVPALSAVAAFGQHHALAPRIEAQLALACSHLRVCAADDAVVECVADANARSEPAALTRTPQRQPGLLDELRGQRACGPLAACAASSTGIVRDARVLDLRGQVVAVLGRWPESQRLAHIPPELSLAGARAWHGAPYFDEPSQTRRIEIAVPVLAAENVAGLLVAELDLAHLEALAADSTVD